MSFFQQELRVNDTVAIDVLVRNITTNLTIENAVAHVTITDPEGHTVHDQVRAIENLVPGQAAEFRQTLVLSQALVGSYQLAAELRSQDGVVYGSDRSDFIVTNILHRALRGDVTAAFPVLYAGEDQTCVYAVSNTGTAPFQGLSISQIVVNIDDETTVDERARMVDLSPGDATEDSVDFSTSGFQPGNYACVLTANVDGDEQSQAYAMFRVETPPVDMDGEITTGTRGRLLVLVDRVKPKKAMTQTHLRQLLEEAGWLATFVDRASDFQEEMNTGGYSLYALFSESVKFDKETQEALIERIARGEGLLVAGDHDRRNRFMEEALGIAVRGNVPHARGVSIDQSELGEAWMEMFLDSSKVLNFIAEGANVIGHYITGRNQRCKKFGTNPSFGCDANPRCGPGGSPGDNAVAMYDYYAGRSVFAGFNLPLEAYLHHRSNPDDDDNPFAAFLLSALACINPDSLALSTGRTVPVIVDIHNLGMATDGRVLLEFSDNLTVIDGGEFAAHADLDGRLWEYPFFMDADESRSLTFYVQLPFGSGAGSDSSNCSDRKCRSTDKCLKTKRSVGCDPHPTYDPDADEEEARIDLLLQSGLEPDLVTHIDAGYFIVVEHEN